MTFLTVPIAAKNPAEAKRQIAKARTAGAELLELRIDFLDKPGIELLRSLVYEAKSGRRSLPIIVTCRDKRQGGAKDWAQKLRTEILVSAIKTGAEFIDCEYENFIRPEVGTKIKAALSENPGGRMILSAHNSEKNFDDINKLYEDISGAAAGAIPKLVYTANHINDSFEALDLLHKTKGERIIFCMGEAGLISRIVAKKLGSFLTFASLDEATATAPGQVTIERLKKLYRWSSINAQTKLFAIIGSPVAHSLSPAIHNACFEKAGLNNIYLPLLVEGGKAEFDKFMQNVISRPWLDFRGFSVTIPHKVNALNFVKDTGGFVEPLAEKIGAANTIIIKPDSSLAAYNTDYAGALDAITSTLGITRKSLRGWRVAVVGAGGVSRAIIAGLTDMGAKVKIYNRTVPRAEKLAAEFNCNYAPLSDISGLDADLLINCTSIGMHPNTSQSPVPAECLKKHIAVFDTVYNPPETLLLKQAKQASAKTIDGMSMFIAQAAAQFKLFTDICIDSQSLQDIEKRLRLGRIETV